MVSSRAALVDTLRQRLYSGLHLGLVKPGSRLPSARDLAAELGASRRTVLTAYQELEREGLVERRERSGIYVRAPGHAVADALSRRARRVVQFLLQELADGIPAPAAPERLHRTVGALRLRAAAVECNHDQIDSLVAELQTDYGLETSGVDVGLLVAGGTSTPPLAVRRADILVTTPFHAGVVKEVAERLGKPWLAATTRTDMPAAIARLLLTGSVYVVVADPRFAEKLGQLFAPSPGAANLRALVVDRDALDRIPADAPVYLTDRARARLVGTPLVARGTPEPRALSAESAAELLTFMVRANMSATSEVAWSGQLR